MTRPHCIYDSDGMERFKKKYNKILMVFTLLGQWPTTNKAVSVFWNILQFSLIGIHYIDQVIKFRFVSIQNGFILFSSGSFSAKIYTWKSAGLCWVLWKFDLLDDFRFNDCHIHTFQCFWELCIFILKINFKEKHLKSDCSHDTFSDHANTCVFHWLWFCVW